MRISSLIIVFLGSFAYADEWPRPKPMAFVPLPSPIRVEAEPKILGGPNGSVSPVYLYLNLPDDAILWLNDKPMSNNGAFRKYTIPQFSGKGVYRVKAMSRGKTVEKTVDVTNGVDCYVDFRKDFGFALQRNQECHCPDGCPCPGRAGTGDCNCHVQPVSVQYRPAVSADSVPLLPVRGYMAVSSGGC